LVLFIKFELSCGVIDLLFTVDIVYLIGSGQL